MFPAFVHPVGPPELKKSSLTRYPQEAARSSVDRASVFETVCSRFKIALKILFDILSSKLVKRLMPIVGRAWTK